MFQLCSHLKKKNPSQHGNAQPCFICVHTGHLTKHCLERSVGPSSLTEYVEQANEYGRERRHAEPHHLLLVPRPAVQAPVSVRTDTVVSFAVQQVDAAPAVQARVAQALVGVRAVLAVLRDRESFRAPV